MSNLSSFNIENLFSSDKKNTPICTGQLDIKTLFHQDNDAHNYKFDSNILLNQIYEKKEKVKKHYNTIYKKCCETIKSANKLGFTFVSYEIPKFSDCIGYNCSDCIDFIKKNLEEQLLEVCKIEHRTININWNNLENKKK